jgi:hypothetical protein
MNYIDHIKLHHSLVSFSESKSIFYISLWNGVLRDGRIDDIDILFVEAKNPIIFNGYLSFHNNNSIKNIFLTPTQLTHLSLLFPQSH